MKRISENWYEQKCLYCGVNYVNLILPEALFQNTTEKKEGLREKWS